MVSSLFLPMTPEDATNAVKTLDLANFGIELIPIPVQGGCIIAVIEHNSSAADRAAMPGRWLKHLRHQRAVGQAMSLLRHRAAILPSSGSV